MVTKKAVCCICCMKPLDLYYSLSYDHEDGLKVGGKKRRQWVYTVCKKCGYQNSFKKLEPQISNIDYLERIYR